MPRVLDLGCGFGKEITITDVSSSDDVIGLDVALDRLETAKTKFPARRFVRGQGEALPFRDQTFQTVVCQLALPYMNIPIALGEINRVLAPGGAVHLSLHAFRFTLHELTVAFPRPKALRFRFWVLLNGFILHYTGKPVAIGGCYESFQTRRGIAVALRNAGFDQVSITRRQDHFGGRLVVKAHKPATGERASPLAA